MFKFLKSIETKLLYQLSYDPDLGIMIREHYGELLKIHCKDPYKVLELYKEFHKHLPPQRSKLWLEDRKGDEKTPPRVGGSEVSTLLGNNPKYSPLKSFYLSKLGFTSFDGNIATRWGNLFEDVVTALIEKIYKTKVVEFGSILGLKDGEHHVQSYSPDGLFVYEDKIILSEIKSPWSRRPLGDVPSNYIDQVQIGLSTIRIADYALFFDAFFRVSTLKSLRYDNREYDLKVHPLRGANEAIVFDNNPVYIGYIFFTEKSTEIRGNIQKLMIDILEKLARTPNISNMLSLTQDLGIYRSFFRQYLSRKLTLPLDAMDLEIPPYYFFDISECESEDIIILREDEDPLDYIYEKTRTYIKENRELIAIVPWKLFDFKIVRVDPAPGYLESVSDKIKKVMKDIFELKLKKISQEELLELKPWDKFKS